MAGELEAMEACCPVTVRWMESVLEARCAQVAERGAPPPPECR